jgi:FkbM family methyltransferase
MNIKAFLQLPVSVIHFAMQARRSHYGFRDKVRIFRTFFAIYVKSEIFRHKGPEAYQKFLGYDIYGYDFPNLTYLFEEVFLSGEYRFVSETQQPRIIDCGANIGTAILFFKRLYPECSIQAFEPNPPAYRFLEKNIKENSLSDVRPLNLCLSDEAGEIEFFPDDAGGLQSSVEEERGHGQGISVKAEKLSSFMKGQEIDLVKMDIEGAENQVIKDLYESGTIRNAKQYIIEYHHKIANRSGALSSFLEIFEKSGFDYNIKCDFRRLGFFQDILIHFYRIG